MKKVIVEFLKKNWWMCIVSIMTFILSSLLGVLPAKMYQLMIDEGFYNKSLKVVLVTSVVLIVIYLLKACMTYISNHKLLLMGNEITSEMKDSIIEKLFSLELNFLSSYDVGYISSRLEEVAGIDALFSNISISFVASILESIISIVFIATLSGKFVIILMLPVPLMIWYAYQTGKNLNSLFIKNAESGANYVGKMNETINGMETIRSLGNEKETQERITKYKNESMKNERIQAIGLNKFSSVLGVIGSMVSVFIYLVGGILMIYDELTMGAFIAISMYAGRIYSPIMSFAGVYTIWCPAVVGLRRVSEFFFDEEHLRVENNGNIISRINRIDYINVAMSYGAKSVFKDLNISISRGDKIQINGSNGAGKSTFVKLLLGIIRPKDGYIKINGLDYQDISRQSILNRIAYVPQKQFVFNETVIQNVTIGIEDYDKELLEELIEEFDLKKIMEGIDDNNVGKIGEQGKKLSGGEVQKIAICRAILRDKEIMIFDEATNNLDDKSIAFIKKYIGMSNKTWIIIDHQNDFSDLGFKQVDI